MWLYAMFLVVSSATAEYCGNSTGNHSNCSSSVRYVCQDGCVASIDICQFGCASGECLSRPNVTYPPPRDDGPMLRFLAITAAILFSVLTIGLILICKFAPKTSGENKGGFDILPSEPSPKTTLIR